MRWRALKPTRVSDREATCVPSWSGVTWLLELSCYPLWGFWRQRNRPVPVVDLYVGWLKLSTIRRHAPSLAATKTSVMADWLWKETPSLRRSSASSMAIQPQHWNDTPKLLKKTKNRMRHAIKGIQPPSTTPSFTTLPYYKPPFFFLIIPGFLQRSIGSSCLAENKMGCMPKVEIRCCPANVSVFFPISALSALTGGVFCGKDKTRMNCNKFLSCFRWTRERDTGPAIDLATCRFRALWNRPELHFGRRLPTGS